MSNSVTTVVTSLLTLSASEIAKRFSEINISVSLAAKDQSISGRGCVGFDVRELPWAQAAKRHRFEMSFSEDVLINTAPDTGL